MEILYLLALVVSVLVLVLLIRFLWMVPNELRSISSALRSESSKKVSRTYVDPDTGKVPYIPKDFLDN